MLNHVMLIGRLVQAPELMESESGKKYSHITLAVPRNFKNLNGEYETDLITCVLWQGIAESTSEFCKKGDLLGVKGRIQVRSYEVKKEKKYITEVIAERISFLSSSK